MDVHPTIMMMMMIIIIEIELLLFVGFIVLLFFFVFLCLLTFVVAFNNHHLDISFNILFCIVSSFRRQCISHHFLMFISMNNSSALDNTFSIQVFIIIIITVRRIKFVYSFNSILIFVLEYGRKYSITKND